MGIPTGLKLFDKAGHTLDSDKNKQKQALDEIGLWLFIQLNKTKNSAGILRFEKDIQEFEKLDKTESYSSNAILVTGSSYIRLWKTVKQDLAPYEIIHRGFGGSNIAEIYGRMPDNNLEQALGFLLSPGNRWVSLLCNTRPPANN